MTEWVNKRAECSPASVFEKLKVEIENDVTARNELITQNRDNKFSFEVSDNGRAIIICLHAKFIEGSSLREVNDCVVVRLEGKTIVFKDRDLKEKFRATLTLNERGECRLKVNGYEHETWRFRQMVLEDLFFNILP